MSQDEGRETGTEQQEDSNPTKPEPPKVSRRAAIGMLAGGAVAGVAVSRLGFQSSGEGQASDIAKSRGLSGQDVTNAVKTYVPGGSTDEYMLFASGGHSGQVMVVGVPSMRIMKMIAVFTKDAWQGYGFGTDQGNLVLERGTDKGKTPEPLSWGDTHHPASRRPTASTTGAGSTSTTAPTAASPWSTCATSRPSRSSTSPTSRPRTAASSSPPTPSTCTSPR